MLIDYHSEEKYVIIWMANADKQDKHIQEAVRKITRENQQKKIKTVIISSGHESLPIQTANLLEYASEKAALENKIDRESIDLFTTMWYNCLIGKFPYNEVKTHDQRTDA